MTATHAIARGPGPMAGTMISRAGSVIWVRLAVSGWSIRCHVQPDGRTVIEVSDETGGRHRALHDGPLPADLPGPSPSQGAMATIAR